MKKEHTRDYVTEAFRLYAAMEQPTYERAKADIYKTELAKRSGDDPSVAVARAEAAVNNNAPMLLDILAVERTMELLERGEKGYIVEAVKAVYFVRPTVPLRRGVISERVRCFALLYPADTSTVYRWLKEARLLCAAIRGLRTASIDMKRYCVVVERCE